MPRILIPRPLRPYTLNEEAVEIPGESVGGILTALTRQFPDLRPHLYTQEGKLRSFVTVYVNDEDVRHLKGEGTHVNGEDTVSIVVSAAGGTA